MGAHSGNILNGDFSIGLSPGLYVERGEILGQVKNVMVAGNIFDRSQPITVFPSCLFRSESRTSSGMVSSVVNHSSRVISRFAGSRVLTMIAGFPAKE
jgi:hypothetical protein